MRCHGHPGLSIAAVRSGSVQLNLALTRRGASNKGAMSRNTKINIGSITMAFTATLAAEAMKSGKIGWDTPLRNVLGQSFYLQDSYRTAETSLRDLLSHRLGVSDYCGVLVAGLKISKSEFCEKRIRHVEISQSFRSRFLLSSYNEILASYVLEKVRGKSWEEDIQRTVFDHLGMTASRTENRLTAIDWKKVVLGSKNNVFNTLEEEKHMLRTMCPTGCILSTTGDMTKWMMFHIRLAKNRTLTGPDSNNSYHALYEPTTILRSQHRQPPSFPVDDSIYAYGLGFYIGRYRGYRKLSNDGTHGQSRCLVTLVPEPEIGVFSCVNGNNGNTHHNVTLQLVNMLVTDFLLGVSPWVNVTTACLPWTPRLRREWTPPMKSTFQQHIRSHRNDDYFVGVYQHYVFGEVTLTMKDGSLYFQYLSLSGCLQRSQWRDMYYLLLEQHYSDVLDAPSKGFPVYFGKTRRSYNMAVTALGRAFPPIFVRKKTSAAHQVGISAVLCITTIILMTTTQFWKYSTFF
ncbi:hypothetical protein LSAT2_031585 [Lamellibrachia satsuma]|nr:hypothetical protein LSAT2_031585 [Lamellibrachia satsuma]